MGQCQDRQKMIMEKIAAEEKLERDGLDEVRDVVYDYLRRYLGYAEDEIEVNRSLKIKSGDLEDTASVDYLIKVEGRYVAAVQCALASLESRDRHVLALCRGALDEATIPLGVVTDSVEVRLIEAKSGKIISTEVDSIPAREKLDLSSYDFEPLPEEKRFKERRILLAFEVARCPIAKEDS